MMRGGMDHHDLAAAGAFAPGELIADRFEVERLAGEGGMATVYRTRDRETGETVAVKLLRGDAGDHAERLMREARVLAQLGHPGIVRYVAHGTSGSGELYLAMEWLEGEDLSHRLERGPLSVDDTLTLARRAADALAAAHSRGLVHRDLKPSNLFLPGGRVEEAKVLDFGIVRLAQATIVATATGSILGTPAYMAPEQARGEREVTARADIFSLGCVVSECLTGRQVFSGEHALAVLARILLEEAPRVREARPDVSEPLDDLVARMLSKDPAERPAGAQALLEELENLPAAAAAAVSGVVVEVPVGITTGEQRVLAVVLVASSPATMREVPQTFHLAASQHGGRLERLADGSVLVVLSGSAAATDLVREAARCALGLRALVPGVAIALATGRGTLTGRLPVGEVIDRAVDRLRHGRPDDEGPRLDDVSAGLLSTRFQVSGDDLGFVLARERGQEEEARTLLGKPTPCVGRERELSTLRGLWEECLAEPMSRAVVVTAGAGVGKSRLRSEFVRQSHQPGEPAEVWMARGDPISAGAAFGMIGQLVRRAGGVAEAEPLAVRQQKLRARIARHLASTDATRVVEFLSELAGAPLAADDAGPELRAARLDPRAMGDQMLRAFEDFLAAECAAQPLLIVLEDLHWGDAPSVRFVDSALRNLKEQPLMVLAMGRPELEDLFPKLWAERGAQSIRLGELSARASAKLVREVLGSDTPQETVERLVGQAAGNAFYLEELIRAVAEGRQDGLPDTVVAMAQARLEQFDPEARRLLRAASVFGQWFWRGGVGTLLGGQPRGSALDRLLGSLDEREIFTVSAESRFPGEPQFRFRQALVREAAYAALTDDDRTLGHRLAGGWLERSGESDAVSLAEHFDRGGEPARALPWYVEAANQGLQGNDLVAVLGRTARGVACGASGETLARLRWMQGQAHMWRGEHREEQACALEAMSLLEAGSARWCHAVAMAIQAGTSLGEEQGVAAVADALFHQAQGTTEPSPELVMAVARGVQALLHLGRYERAEEFVRWLDVVGEPAAPPESRAVAQILIARATQARIRGDALRFLTLIERAAEVNRALGLARTECQMRENIGYGYLQLGMYAKAQQALEDVLVTARRMGLRVTVAVAMNNLGLARALGGAIDEGRRLEEEALAQAVLTGNVRLIGGVQIYLARVLALAGDREGAEREARAAVETLAKAPPLQAYALGVLSEALHGVGRPEEGREAARQAMAIVEDLGTLDEGEILVRLAHAEALEAGGDHDGARAAIAEARVRVLRQADKIGDAAFRASFLEQVPENARVLARAEAWIGPAGLGAP